MCYHSLHTHTPTLLLPAYSSPKAPSPSPLRPSPPFPGRPIHRMDVPTMDLPQRRQLLRLALPPSLPQPCPADHLGVARRRAGGVVSNKHQPLLCPESGRGRPGYCPVCGYRGRAGGGGGAWKLGDSGFVGRGVPGHTLQCLSPRLLTGAEIHVRECVGVGEV